MNETLRTLETRRSVRSFDPNRLPSDALINAVVRAGEYAPLVADCSRHASSSSPTKPCATILRVLMPR